MKYSWPGNVRQLRNVVESALLLTDGESVSREKILSFLPASGRFEKTSGQSLTDVEKIAIERALKSCNGNKAAAAKILGIPYSTLFQRMKKYRIMDPQG